MHLNVPTAAIHTFTNTPVTLRQHSINLLERGPALFRILIV